MDPNEEYVETLLNMGFPHEQQIRYALQKSKNDMNEAINILTSESNQGFESYQDYDVEMSEVSPNSGQPPRYEDVANQRTTVCHFSFSISILPCA